MQTQTLFRWGLEILFNVLPSPIYVLVIVQVLQSCKPVCNLNLILFPNLWLIKLPQVISLPIKPLCSLLTTNKTNLVYNTCCCHGATNKMWEYFYLIWNGVIKVDTGVNYMISYNVDLILHIKTSKIDNSVLNIWHIANSLMTVRA